MRKSVFFAASGVALAASLAFGGAALAQSEPNAMQLINALKPTGSVSDTTRGIRPLGPGDMPGMGASGTMAPGGSMSSGSHMAMAPAAMPVQPSANLDIMFESGSATLTPQAVAELNQLGKALTSPALASYKFKIVGHTDTMGTPARNQALSNARAKAVEQFLETKFSVSPARLTCLGVGESDLLVQTPPQTPELKNRRVQVVNLGA